VPLPKFSRRHAAIAGLLVALVAATSCSAHSAKSQGSVASHLIMGGPSECPTRITCLLGLERIYRLRFKSFKALDEVGPLSEAALGSGVAQVVRLDSSDPTIPKHHWVILQDDKSFQQAGNIIPVIRSSKATPALQALIDKVSATMTQGDLFMLDAEVGLDNEAPQAAAAAFVRANGLAGTAKPGTQESITVGSAAFSENETLADIYIDVLSGAGYVTTAKLNIGSRETYEPELAAGQVDLLPEYVGNYLTFLDPAVSNLPLAQSVATLRTLLAPKGLTVLDPFSATDSDTIVVTQATSTRYHLTKISDLGAPYPG
jgi:osmoprotectant transport system substrate-binding protein